jgi:hypothetical protein
MDSTKPEAFPMKDGLWDPKGPSVVDYEVTESNVTFHDDVSAMRGPNLLLAMLAGLAAAVLGVIVWGSIVYFSGYYLAWLIPLIALPVGRAVKWAGQGESPIFGVVGAVCALLGAVTGKLVVAVIDYSIRMKIPLQHATQLVDANVIREFLWFSLTLDLLLYAIAMFIAYNNSFTKRTNY